MISLTSASPAPSLAPNTEWALMTAWPTEGLSQLTVTQKESGPPTVTPSSVRELGPCSQPAHFYAMSCCLAAASWEVPVSAEIGKD